MEDVNGISPRENVFGGDIPSFFLQESNEIRRKSVGGREILVEGWVA